MREKDVEREWALFKTWTQEDLGLGQRTYSKETIYITWLRNTWGNKWQDKWYLNGAKSLILLFYLNLFFLINLFMAE